MTDELEYWKQRCLLAEDFKEILQKIDNGKG